MEKQQQWKPRTGPKKKNRTAKQLTITLAPELYNRLMTYMESHSLYNRSGAIASLIENSLSNLPLYTLDDKADC